MQKRVKCTYPSDSKNKVNIPQVHYSITLFKHCNYVMVIASKKKKKVERSLETRPVPRYRVGCVCVFVKQFCFSASLLFLLAPSVSCSPECQSLNEVAALDPETKREGCHGMGGQGEQLRLSPESLSQREGPALPALLWLPGPSSALVRFLQPSFIAGESHSVPEQPSISHQEWKREVKQLRCFV